MASVYDLRELPRTLMRQAALLAVLLSVAVYVVAQSKRTPEGPKSEVQRPASDGHSFIELFGRLERDWGLAAEKKDQKSLNEIMADEFIERDATDPENMITRMKWMHMH
jgi:hypothetical protein